MHAVAFLQTNVPDFIEQANWPPNSPELNPIWGEGSLQQTVRTLIIGSKS